MARPRRVIVAAVALVALFAGCNEIAGIREGDPLGGPIACDRDSDCPAPAEPECATFVACEANICAYADELDGKVVSTQIAGDCSQRVCDGKGGVRLQVNDADVDDGDPCTLDACDGGLPTHTSMQELPCYEGPPGTAGVGICTFGTQHCDESFQPIGGCNGQILPEPETCLTLEDDDCDGEFNEEGEGCVCTPSINSACYTGPAGAAGVGICKAGTCLCNHDGTACETVCAGEVLPQPEDCATPEDEDCDGESVDPEDGCVCEAGKTTSCYTGPPGTLGVGLCAAGIQTCDLAGKAYVAPCSDVVPNAFDHCTVPGDDDCDGVSIDACTGTAGWMKASTTVGGYSSSHAPVTIGLDDASNLYAVGRVRRASGATIDLGGGPLTPPPHGTSYSAYVVKLSPSGAHLWSKLLPCAELSQYQSPRGAVAGNQVVVAFSVNAQYCDFGSGTQAYTSGVALIRLDAANGAFVSSTVIGSSNTRLFSLAASSNAIFLGGYQYSSGSIGGTSFSQRPFVAKINASNSVEWVKSFPLSSYTNGYDENRVRALVVLPGDAVAFAGRAGYTTIDLGYGPLGGGSYENHYYGVLESGSALRWGGIHAANGGSSAAYPPVALALSPSGQIVALGRTYNGMTIGAVTLEPDEGYVAWFDPAAGTAAQVKPLPPTYENYLDSLSVDALGQVGIAGRLSTGESMGGPPASSSGDHITKLDHLGNHLWTKPLPNTDPSVPTLVVPAPDGGLFVSSRIYGVQTIDGITVGASSMYELLFGRLAP